MNKYSPYILYLLISILVVVLCVNDFGPIVSLQQELDDFLHRLTADEGTRPNIALVTIDERSQEQYGKWPWNHDLVADLTAAVASAEPKALVLDMELYEDANQDSAGYTAILAQQLSWIDQAVLSYDIALAPFRSDKTSNPEHLFNNSIPVENPLGIMDEQSSLLARKVFLPADKLLEDNPHLGFKFHRPDHDRIMRHQPVVVNYEGYYYPSIELLAAAVYLGVPTDNIKIIEGESIQIGAKHSIPITNQGEFIVSFSKDNSFGRYSAADILSEGFDFSTLKNKAVIVAPSEGYTSEFYQTPVNESLSPAAMQANVIENIINGNILTKREDLAKFNLIIILLLGAGCAFLLPRISLMYRMIILGGGVILLANVNYVLFASYHFTVPTVFIGLQLILFMIGAPMLQLQLFAGDDSQGNSNPNQHKVPPTRRRRSRPVEPPVREIKSSVRDQSELKTTALAKDADIGEDLSDSSPFDHQNISLDQDQSPDKTLAATLDSDNLQLPNDDADEVDFDPDASSDWESSKDMSKESGAHAAVKAEEEPQFDSNGVPVGSATPDITNLGRYQVTYILGKGAMGTVYKGVDPAINRPVALKTIRLDFVSDPEELAELKERLHREAQAAGKLSHPNIVTIYDVGSEGSLQYIAMEYLEGQTLEELIKKKVRFNYRIIAQIISQICAAMEYAHEYGIVHRDIKPANIMVLSDYRIKVMDFGIARVDSNSMTKTGIAMGTPNYISPEQLKGVEIDRRADLFSLGVVMYEMLLGRRPFKGENLTSLMYSIMNREPEKPSSVNPQVPLLFDHIIGRALRKDPNERYQKASEVSADLQDFVESFAR